MSFNHVVAWIDHAQAHIIHFNREHAENEVVKAHSTHQHGAKGSSHGAESAHYFDGIANALQDALEILIVGPGLEKLALMKHLIKHQHAVAEKVLSVETVDHPSDAQLLAYAKKYFMKADRMR